MIKQETRVEKSWVSHGRKCVILWVGTHYTAYIETKLDISYSGGILSDDYDDTSPSSNINCHGGLTFSGKLRITPFEKDINYFGWDYAHSGDYMSYYDEDEPEKHKDEHKWTIEEVEKQVEEVIPQITEYESRYESLKPFVDEIKKKIKEIFKQESNI